MNQARFTFKTHGNEVVDVLDVNLLDHNSAKAWQYAVMLNDPSRLVAKRSAISFFPNHNQATVNRLYLEIKNCVDNLANTEFAYPYSLPHNTAEIDQPLMNSLHRHFTQTCFTIWQHNYNKPEQVPYLDQISHKLNETVHQLELYIPTSHKIAWQGQGTEVWVRSINSIGFDINPFRTDHSYEPADLIMDGYILGKTLMESFITDDDPNQWDTSGHVRTNGGAIFILDRTRYNIYNSEEFLQWASRHKVDKQNLPSDIPLGNFATGHKQRLEQLMNLPEFSQVSCDVTIVI
jgi:hypothetical protein